MKIVIDNIIFPYDIGCRLTKLKYEKCPYKELEEIWDSIQPMTFSEIAVIDNMEQRRVGVLCLGLERLAAEVKPKLIDRQTIKKSTTWINEDGTLKEVQFEDIYELYEVDGSYFNHGTIHSYQKADNCYFVKCKDTSTDRYYFIWVDPNKVYQINYEPNVYYHGQISKEKLSRINAIQCIAWTIQTNVKQGQIEKIIRQGDCILIKPKTLGVEVKTTIRHLTEKEYRTLLVAES